MSLSYTLVEEIVGPAAGKIRSENSFSGDGGLSPRQVSIPDSSTDLLVNFACDVSQLQLIYMKSDQDITIETNDGTTPDDTINLKAGKPYVWYTGSYFTNLLTTDVTALYVTNSSGSTATLEIDGIEDSTP